MNSRKYSVSQVLCGLQHIWSTFIGSDRTFDSESNIVEYLKADGIWDDVDFNLLFRAIEDFFGFTCSDTEWTLFYETGGEELRSKERHRTVAPNLTFGALARFIADRAPVMASFDPISICGQKCHPAGIFTGIQQVANRAAGKRLRFAPSSRIIETMCGHTLDEFWFELRWLTENATPELPSFWSSVTGVTGCLGFITVIASIVVSWKTSELTWVIYSLLCSVGTYLIASTYKYFTNPLPENLTTFRDLSMLIAKSE